MPRIEDVSWFTFLRRYYFADFMFLFKMRNEQNWVDIPISHQGVTQMMMAGLIGHLF